jgi:hypothetical protein
MPEPVTFTDHFLYWLAIGLMITWGVWMLLEFCVLVIPIGLEKWRDYKYDRKRKKERRKLAKGMASMRDEINRLAKEQEERMRMARFEISGLSGLSETEIVEKVKSVIENELDSAMYDNEIFCYQSEEHPDCDGRMCDEEERTEWCDTCRPFRVRVELYRDED